MHSVFKIIFERLRDALGVNYQSLLQFNRAHDDIDRIFDKHQEALLSSDIPEAQRRIGEFAKALRIHIRCEENWLLPLYEERCRGFLKPRNQSISRYLYKHQKILNLLEIIQTSLNDFGQGEPISSSETMALLEREQVLRNFIAHHNFHENNDLHPNLDRLTSGKERGNLLMLFSREMDL